MGSVISSSDARSNQEGGAKAITMAANIHHHYNDDAQQQPPSGPAQDPHFSSSPHQHRPLLEPVSGKLLFDQECRRRDALWRTGRGRLATGCGELDDCALAGGDGGGEGGFERGCVVGVSAEEGAGLPGGEGAEDDVALVMGLQTVARMLVGARRRGERPARAMIISTMGAGALAGLVRDALGAQIAEAEGQGEGVDKRVLRELLGRIAISRVFDVPGLWEVLGELDRLPPSQELGEEEEETLRDDEMPLEASADQHRVTDDRRQEAMTHSPPSTGEQDAAATLEAGGPSSSPLSDPPSSLPDEPPWETTDMGEAVLPQRTTPPGLREVIQDSEEEDEGLLPPVVVAKTSPEKSPVKISEPGLKDKPSSRAAPDDKQDTGQLELLLAAHHEPDLRDQSGAEQLHEACQSLPGTSQVSSENEAILSGISTVQHIGAQAGEKAVVSEPAKDNGATPPDIILITHMSTLLSSLFHQREKVAAHEMLQLLASHLRYLTRAPEHGGPLIMILNSTSSSNTPPPNQDRDGAPAPPPEGPSPPTPNKPPLDPTLRSIFNPPPLHASGLPYSYDTPHARRNKPSFGLVFSQMLDLHLLCTRVPKARTDAEALYAPGARAKRVEYAWVVEVLLDEIGVWEGRGRVLEGRPRRSREQRWGAVQVRRDARGVKIVDAFERKEEGGTRVVAAASGFGGRRFLR